MTKTDKSTAARAMRELDLASRNAAILASADVLDLRPRLIEMAKQRALGFAYRKPVSPNPGDAA